MKGHTIEYIKSELRHKNIELLDELYFNMKQLLNLKCKICNYQWKTNADNLLNKNSGCPECAGNAKHTFEFVKNYLREINIKLISEKYVNSATELNLECMADSCYHIWNTTFSAIYNNGTKCPACYGNNKYDIGYVRQFLLDKNIELLSKNYKNGSSKLKLKCLDGECNCVWATCFDHLHNSDSGCPKCNKFGGKTELLVGKCLEQFFGINKITPQYLIKLDDRKVYIDYFVNDEDKKWAVEYNGRQHYVFPNFFHKTKKEFNNQQKRDEELKQYCIDNKINLIIIDGRKIKKQKILLHLEKMFNKTIKKEQ